MNNLNRHNYSHWYVIFNYLETDNVTVNTYWFKVLAKNQNHSIAVFGHTMGENLSMELVRLRDVLEVVDEFTITSEDYYHVKQW